MANNLYSGASKVAKKGGTLYGPSNFKTKLGKTGSAKKSSVARIRQNMNTTKKTNPKMFSAQKKSFNSSAFNKERKKV